MGMDEDKIREGLDGLKELETAIAQKILFAEEEDDPEQRDRRERLKFLSLPVQQVRRQLQICGCISFHFDISSIKSSLDYWKVKPP